MSNNAQVTGFMTVTNSKKYSDEIKQKIVDAPDGKVRAIRKVLIDPETNEEVIITGKLTISKSSGSLTSRIAFSLNNIQSLIIDDNKNKKADKPKKEVDVEKVAADLGMEGLV